MRIQVNKQSVRRTWFVSLSIVGSVFLTTGCDGLQGSAADDDATSTSPTAHMKEAPLAPQAEATVGTEVADNTGTPSSATVDIRSDRGRLSPIAVGVNAAAWDGHLVDGELPTLLRGAGLQVLRYPGGSTSDNYHWLSNMPDDPAQGGTTPSANFDAFMSVV